MIITNYSELFQNVVAIKDLELCREFIKSNDVEKLSPGSYEIDGKRVYANVATYETKESNLCIWEAHKKYLDLHYIISGEENIKVSNINTMKTGNYTEESDYLQISGIEQYTIPLAVGNFLLLTTQEAHMTGCKTNTKMWVKKIIFKISVETKPIELNEN